MLTKWSMNFYEPDFVTTIDAFSHASPMSEAEIGVVLLCAKVSFNNLCASFSNGAQWRKS